MLIELICGNEFVFGLAKEEYIDYVCPKSCENPTTEYGEDIIPYTEKGNNFVVYINEDDVSLMGFLSFIQKSEFYKDFFETVVTLEEIEGFDSSNAVDDAVDAFNLAQTSYYIDPSGDVEVEAIECDSDSIVFIPLFQDKTLEEIFWDFVKRNSILTAKLITRREKCRKD